MLSVTPILDIKYKEKCLRCIHHHLKKYGVITCAFKSLDNCYCPQIEKEELNSKEVFWF